MSVPLLSTTRNGVVERVEHGYCVVADAGGSVLWSIGNPDHVTYLRSSAKPLQATAMILSGAVDRFGLTDSNIAVACGSHCGEPRHVQTALQTLRSAGVPADALGCGTHELHGHVGARLAAAGLAPGPLHNNCSGKHAGMLASAVALGSSVETYLHNTSALQRLILDAVAHCSGLRADQISIGIDGCSAPNFAMPMHSIARSFATLADQSRVPQELGAALRRVVAAMRQDPWLVAGSGEFDTVLMSSCPELVVAKAGAEALHCVGLPRLGLGVAVKFESGQSAGISSVVLAILGALGILGKHVAGTLSRFNSPPIRNHRQYEVGETLLHIDEELAVLAELNHAPA